MTTYYQKRVDGLQAVDAKQDVREALLKVCEQHGKQSGTHKSFLGLPASKCIFEKMFRGMCDKNGWITEILGVEKDKGIRIKARKNLPSNARIVGRDFDKVVNELSPKNELGIVWADYCGNYANKREGGLCYPHINTFAKFAKCVVKSDSRGLYFLTFNMNGRDIGKYTPSDVTRVINIALHNNKVNGKVQEVFRYIYDGGEKGVSKMLTIGFAINYYPKYEKVDINVMTTCFDKKGQYIPKTSTVNEKVDKIAERQTMRREAIKVLIGAGWTSEKIGKAFVMKPMKVAGMRASITKEMLKISGQDKDVLVMS